MTREEAIRIIDDISCNGNYRYTIQKYLEAKKMAIEALSAEPCEDCISRVDALKDLALTNGKDDVYRMLTNLPSVHPMEKIGKWIKEKKHHKDDFQEFDYLDIWCSECGARKRIGWANIHYCPMCGAKMSENPTGSNSEEGGEEE